MCEKIGSEWNHGGLGKHVSKPIRILAAASVWLAVLLMIFHWITCRKNTYFQYVTQKELRLSDWSCAVSYFLFGLSGRGARATGHAFFGGEEDRRRRSGKCACFAGRSRSSTGCSF